MCNPRSPLQIAYIKLVLCPTQTKTAKISLVNVTLAKYCHVCYELTYQIAKLRVV